MNLGTIELYIILFSLVTIIGSYIVKPQKSLELKFFRLLSFGIAGIFLLAGLITPPDLISTLMIAIPGILIYSIIVTIQLKNRNSNN